jgi:hypothetical protein
LAPFTAAEPVERARLVAPALLLDDVRLRDDADDDPSSTTGTPEMRCRQRSRATSRSGVSGDTLTGGLLIRSWTLIRFTSIR